MIAVVWAGTTDVPTGSVPPDTIQPDNDRRQTNHGAMLGQQAQHCVVVVCTNTEGTGLHSGVYTFCITSWWTLTSIVMAHSRPVGDCPKTVPTSLA